jgi:hypothetical protein
LRLLISEQFWGFTFLLSFKQQLQVVQRTNFALIVYSVLQYIFLEIWPAFAAKNTPRMFACRTHVSELETAGHRFQFFNTVRLSGRYSQYPDFIVYLTTMCQLNEDQEW